MQKAKLKTFAFCPDVGQIASLLGSNSSFIFELQAMLNDRSITTVLKVIGGLSADQLRTGRSRNSNSWCFVDNIVRADIPSLTFKIYHGQTIA